MAHVFLEASGGPHQKAKPYDPKKNTFKTLHIGFVSKKGSQKTNTLLKET